MMKGGGGERGKKVERVREKEGVGTKKRKERGGKKIFHP